MRETRLHVVLWLVLAAPVAAIQQAADVLDAITPADVRAILTGLAELLAPK